MMDLRRSKRQSSVNEKESLVTSKKRKQDITKEECRRKKVQNRNQGDTYCWVCHTLAQDIVCPNCPRVFHRDCVQNFESFIICPECQCATVSSESSSNCKNLKELLNYAIDIVFSVEGVKDIFLKWPQNECNDKLNQIIDQQILVQRLQADSYKNPVQLLADFKYIAHNCYILYGEKSASALCAEQLTKKLQEEVYNLEACSDCYYYKNSKLYGENYFFQKCTKSHDVVWAKVKGFTYWPAKCLKVNKSGSARVAFFGTHEMATVSAHNWFSLNLKSQSALSRKKQQLCAGVNELMSYLHNTSNVQVMNKRTVSTETSPISIVIPPDSSSTPPDSGSLTPNIGSSSPDSDSSTSNIGSSTPDGSLTPPDGGSTQPNSSALTSSDSVVAHPDSAMMSKTSSEQIHALLELDNSLLHTIHGPEALLQMSTTLEAMIEKMYCCLSSLRKGYKPDIKNELVNSKDCIYSSTSSIESVSLQFSVDSESNDTEIENLLNIPPKVPKRIESEPPKVKNSCAGIPAKCRLQDLTEDVSKESAPLSQINLETAPNTSLGFLPELIDLTNDIDDELAISKKYKDMKNESETSHGPRQKMDDSSPEAMKLINDFENIQLSLAEIFHSFIKPKIIKGHNSMQETPIKVVKQESKKDTSGESKDIIEGSLPNIKKEKTVEENAI